VHGAEWRSRAQLTSSSPVDTVKAESPIPSASVSIRGDEPVGEGNDSLLLSPLLCSLLCLTLPALEPEGEMVVIEDEQSSWEVGESAR